MPHSFVLLTRVASTYPAGVLPGGYCQSLPIPLVHEGALQAGYLFSAVMLDEPQTGLKMLPPSYLARIDAESGKFVQLQSCTPATFGLKDAVDKPLGNARTQSECMEPEFLTQLGKFHQTLDLIAPTWLAGEPSAKCVDAVRECRGLFSDLQEAPLKPYYAAVGRDFFVWLDG